MSVDPGQLRRIHAQRKQEREEAARGAEIEAELAKLAFQDATGTVVGDLFRHVERLHLVDSVCACDLSHDVDVLGDVGRQEIVGDGHGFDRRAVVRLEIEDEALLGHVDVKRRTLVAGILDASQELANVGLPFDALGFRAPLQGAVIDDNRPKRHGGDHIRARWVCIPDGLAAMVGSWHPPI